MGWELSRFRAGDAVEVRSKEEILATLDESGAVDAMPFMPEMLQFCGKRFRVSAVAHKTCDTICMAGARRVRAAVHLEGVRCDGCAHSGCQAECNLFWKDAWLKPVGGPATAPASPKISEAQLCALTRQSAGAGEEPRYVCQATNLLKATEELPWWDVRQYFRDVFTGNHRAGCVLRALYLASVRRILRHAPLGYRIIESFYNGAHRLLMGGPSPFVMGTIAEGKGTPTGRLELQAGELVRIRAKAEIEKTIDENGKNRGLSFDKEMAPYCGNVVKVRKPVDRIIDESTGKMRTMKQPCVMLDGVVCKGSYTEKRLMCPRAIPSYWREIWLERVEQ